MALIDNLICYWKLDEASGDAIDSHGGNHLTDVNAVGTAAGKINTARDFERASGQYFIRDPAGPSVTTGDIDFTISYWCRLESLVDMMSITKWSDLTNTYEYMSRHEGTNQFSFMVRNPANTANGHILASNAGVTSVGVWYHVVCWHDATNDQLGIAVNNGTPNILSWAQGVQAVPSAEFRIGAYGGGLTWDGLIDEVGCWKRVLSPAERTALYNGGAGLAYPFGAATGNGVIAAARATVTGAGAVLAVAAGTGVLAAGSAAASGAGAAIAVSSGVLVSQSAAMSGTGASATVGPGALQASAATMSGTAASAMSGAGVLQAAAAIVSGQHATTAGTGILQAQRALLTGTGSRSGAATSVGLETAIVDRVGALVDGRAYPNTFPQEPGLPTWPAIRYTLVSVDAIDDLCSDFEAEEGGDTADVRVQFDLVAASYVEVRDLRLAMKRAMLGFDPPALAGNEFNTYDTETKVHRVVIDYVFYPSSNPT